MIMWRKIMKVEWNDNENEINNNENNNNMK